MSEVIDEQIETIQPESIEELPTGPNPYNEQPTELAIESVEFESSRVLPSYTIFPDKAQCFLENDLTKLANVCENLQGISQIEEIVAKIDEAEKYTNPEIFFKKTPGHGIKYQKAWFDGRHSLPAELPWYTQEHLLLIQEINDVLKKIAEAVEKIGDKWYWGKDTIDRIKKLTGAPRTDDVRQIYQTNEAVKQLDFTDHIVYHGLSRNALLGVLDSGSLLCRGKQIAERGKARFNTVRAKKEEQEMYNVSFSNNPDRGYTGDWNPHINPNFSAATPQNLWVVTDLGWLVKKGQRFFYSDGWQMMGREDGEGFSLSLENDPVLIMATEESIKKVQERLEIDPRFEGKDTQRWLEAHTVIIPETIFSQDSWVFRLGNQEQVKIKDKMRQLNPDTKLSKQKGFITPSGELFDDQAGNKVMSYCWTEN